MFSGSIISSGSTIDYPEGCSLSSTHGDLEVLLLKVEVLRLEPKMKSVLFSKLLYLFLWGPAIFGPAPNKSNLLGQHYLSVEAQRPKPRKVMAQTL